MTDQKRPWHYPGTHEPPDWPAAEGEAGEDLMFSKPLVDTAKFDEDKGRSFGESFLLYVLMVFLGIVIGTLLARA